MIREFEVVGTQGQRLMSGEIDKGVYRIFSDKFECGYKEFDSLSDLLIACEGVAIQPALFETEAQPRQLSLFGGDLA